MDRQEESETHVASAPPVSFRESLGTWCRVAALSFGGPAGQIATMHRILVDEKRWINEEQFLHALNYCMLLPGPEAQQLATYIGWLMHRARGGLAAGVLFILPGAVAILILSIVYATYQETLLVATLFFGLKPAVLAIVLEAVGRIGKRVLRNGAMMAIAAASFVAIFFGGVPFPLIVLAAGVIGFVGGKLWPARFQVLKGHQAKGGAGAANQTPVPELKFDVATGRGGLWGRSLWISAVCLTLWFGPLVVLRLTLGPTSTLWHEGVFFSQVAVVTFGGAYSVLSYVAQEAVERYGWLAPPEMMDGLSMAETTPGPLIMVVQFVGFLGAYRNPGPFSPLVAGILGSLVTTWVTFVPCFYWIFLGAPFIERLRGNKLLNAALSSITAAVVGVVLNLAVWFSLHVLFGTVATERWQGLRVLVPDWGTLDVRAAAVAVVACLLTFVWRRGMATTLAVSAALGALLKWAF